MARRAQATKRLPSPDIKYGNVTVSKLINKLMERGKKSTAEKILYGALDIIEQQEGKPPVSVLELAIKNASPLLMVKARRVGGATYQVPVEIDPERGAEIAIRWILQSARSRTGKAMAERLATELTEASKEQGNTIKKREDTHKMAEANRAFAHYRW
jgi:small subunit ribosomal protein S7